MAEEVENKFSKFLKALFLKQVRSLLACPTDVDSLFQGNDRDVD